MKKLLLILGVFLVAFSNCKKDDDKNIPQFMSGKKIERIYYEDDDHDKYLDELWTWKDNGRLKSIDYYETDGSIDETHYFTFNDDNLVTKVEDYQHRERTEYEYDGTRLVRCKFFWEEILREYYNLNYEDGKLSSIECSYYGKSGDETHLMAFSNILPDHIVNALAKTKVMNNSSSNDRGITKYSFTWTGPNITKLEWWDMGDGGTCEFEYDNKKNPFCEFYGLRSFDDFNFSANNCIYEMYKENEEGYDETGVVEYRYEYDGDYPTECRRYRDSYGYSCYYYKYIN